MPHAALRQNADFTPDAFAFARGEVAISSSSTSRSCLPVLTRADTPVFTTSLGIRKSLGRRGVAVAGPGRCGGYANRLRRWLLVGSTRGTARVTIAIHSTPLTDPGSRRATAAAGAQARRRGGWSSASPSPSRPGGGSRSPSRTLKRRWAMEETPPGSMGVPPGRVT
jgi:hypothetical protein